MVSFLSKQVKTGLFELAIIVKKRGMQNLYSVTMATYQPLCQYYGSIQRNAFLRLMLRIHTEARSCYNDLVSEM